MQQWKSLSCVLLFETPWAIQSWNSPIQNTGVGSLSLLQGIFPTQRSNPSLLHYKWILYQLSHKGSSRILEWVPYPFSRGSSWPRDWTGVSSIADRLFTNWAIREAQCSNRSINWYKLSEKALGKKKKKKKKLGPLSLTISEIPRNFKSRNDCVHGSFLPSSTESPKDND